MRILILEAEIDGEDLTDMQVAKVLAAAAMAVPDVVSVKVRRDRDVATLVEQS